MTLPSLSPQEFYDRWSHDKLKERSGSQEHLIDLCRRVGHPTPGARRIPKEPVEQKLSRRTLTDLYNQRPTGHGGR